MKKILFSQRVDIIESYGERRDCADQNIARLIYACGYIPIPMVNEPELTKKFCNAIRPDGVLLTGGNDLANYGGNAPERDETEKRLLEYVEQSSTPLLGICRGMQMIADRYGTKLEKVEGHVRKNHAIKGKINRNGVNSFHGMGIRELSPILEELARTEDGVIEAIRHKTYTVMGIMWHPERVDGFDREDIELIKQFYEKGILR